MPDPVMTPPVAALLARLDEWHRLGSGWVARCPAHRDRSPSLSVAAGDDGRVLVHCFAGCDARAITAALGLPLGALFADPRPTARPSRPLTEMERAFRTAYHEGRRQQARQGDHAETAEAIKTGRRAAGALRERATRLGDTDLAWDLLEIAAEWDREAERLDA